MKNKIKNLFFFGTATLWLLSASTAQSLELVIGEEEISPGITFIFEGAIKDTVFPKEQNLEVNQTDVHIEARVNWKEKGPLPPGTPAGGFIPYLRVNATVTSQATGKSTHASLLPHINLIDNFHYARNIALPSSTSDKYEVVFHVHPPGKFDLTFHKDWKDGYGMTLIKPMTFRYRDIDFEEIAKATRN